MIDKNKGIDYSKTVLKNWKKDHESKIRERLKYQKPLKSTIAELESVIELNEKYLQRDQYFLEKLKEFLNLMEL